MKRIFLLICIITTIVTGCDKNVETIEFTIDKYPKYLHFNRGNVTELPININNKTWRVDLRSYDLSELDLRDKYDDLKYASFDTNTIWSDNMPANFIPDEIMDLGKNPGLGLSDIHNEGITGKGISVAIIDQPLPINHTEYYGRIKMYEEINISTDRAQMHGSAVASILGGKSVGVAPKANIYYIAVTPGEFTEDKFEYDFNYLAQAINRIIEVNDILPDDDKIRVISISLGWDQKQKGYDEVTDAIEKAKEIGVFVISSSLSTTYGYNFHGLGREIELDPNDINAYGPGLFWEDWYFNNGKNYYNTLMVPMDSRTTASSTGENDYVFYRAGGWSWSIPYIAGLYALACQVDKQITPEKFWEIALETGDTIEINHDGNNYILGGIVNPLKLIHKIR